jgi:hypothetical protein
MFGFHQKKASPTKQADLRDMFRKVSRSVCTSTVVSPVPFCPIPSTSSATKTAENIEEDPDDPEPAD